VGGGLLHHSHGWQHVQRKPGGHVQGHTLHTAELQGAPRLLPLLLLLLFLYLMLLLLMQLQSLLLLLPD
jgi:hypothetical protein